MKISTKELLAQVSHELGGGSWPAEIDQWGMLNQAGHHLYSMHPWTWAQGRAALLDLRGLVSGSTATWTASTSTLTATGAFAGYDFLDGDELRVQSGTGATAGVYKILTNPTTGTITIDGSLSASNLSTGDIVWRIEPQTIALPADLRDIIWIATTSISSVGGISLTSLKQVLQARSSTASITASTGLYYAAIVFSGSPPRPLLEIWPTPSDNTTGAMRIFYRSRWAEVTADTSEIDIPDFIHDLLIYIVRAYAAGYVRGDVASIHERLAAIHNSPILAVAKRSDGMIQPYFGAINGGGNQIWRRRSSPFLQITNRVEGPSI